VQVTLNRSLYAELYLITSSHNNTFGLLDVKYTSNYNKQTFKSYGTIDKLNQLITLTVITISKTTDYFPPYSVKSKNTMVKVIKEKKQNI
jgi:hypothetical protein